MTPDDVSLIAEAVGMVTRLINVASNNMLTREMLFPLFGPEVVFMNSPIEVKNIMLWHD